MSSEGAVINYYGGNDRKDLISTSPALTFDDRGNGSKDVHVTVSSEEDMQRALTEFMAKATGHTDVKQYEEKTAQLNGLLVELEKQGSNASSALKQQVEELKTELFPPVSLTFSSEPAPPSEEDLKAANFAARLQCEVLAGMLLAMMGRIVTTTTDADQLLVDAEAAARNRDWLNLVPSKGIRPSQRLQSELKDMQRIWMYQWQQLGSAASKRLQWGRVTIDNGETAAEEEEEEGVVDGCRSRPSFVTRVPLGKQDMDALLPPPLADEEEEEEVAESKTSLLMVSELTGRRQPPVAPWPWQTVVLRVDPSVRPSQIVAFCQRLRYARSVELYFDDDSEALTGAALLALVASAGPNLERLVIRSRTPMSRLTPQWLTVLAPSCRRLKQLRLSLTWDAGLDETKAQSQMEAFVTSLARHSRLEELEWHSLSSQVQWADGYTATLTKSGNRTAASLKSLIVAPPFRYTSVSSALAGLQSSCRSLQALHEDMTGFDVGRQDAVPSLRDLFGRVEDLVLNGLRDWSADNFRALFAAGGSWHRVVLNTAGKTNTMGTALAELAASAARGGGEGLPSPLSLLHIGYVHDVDWASFGRLAEVLPDLRSVRISSDTIMPVDILEKFIQHCPFIEEWEIGYQATGETKQQDRPELTSKMGRRISAAWKNLTVFSMQSMYIIDGTTRAALRGVSSTTRRLPSPADVRLNWL